MYDPLSIAKHKSSEHDSESCKRKQLRCGSESLSELIYISQPQHIFLCDCNGARLEKPTAIFNLYNEIVKNTILQV